MAEKLHLAVPAGRWTAVILGLGGARLRDGELSFAPRLAVTVHRIAWPFLLLRRHLRIEVIQVCAMYELRSGPELGIEHGRESLTVTRSAPVSVPISPPATRAPVLRRFGPSVAN